MRGNSMHYEATGDYDVIDFVQDYKLNFNRGNVIKDYIEREIQYVRDLRNKQVQDFREPKWYENSTK